jgi:putative transcriptional regulator
VYLRTNVRTLENWEQGWAKPNAQAALLINLVKRYPDTVERLAAPPFERGKFGTVSI